MDASDSHSGTPKHRYTIFYLLEDVPEGGQFERSALHINILPWFAIKTDEKSFLRWFYSHFDNVAAFEATVDGTAMFGPRKDVPVHLVEPYDKFLKLHELALSWFGKLGAEWAEIDPYVGKDFKPHIAERRGLVLKTGQKLLIDSITLVKAKRHNDDGLRFVAAKAQLHAEG